MTYPLLIVITLFSSFAYAQPYQWIDENGQVHFSDRPHDGALVVDVRVQKPPSIKAGSRTKDINQRIKSASDRLASERKKEEYANQKKQLGIIRQNQNGKKKCQYYMDKAEHNEYRWKLLRTQGYKQAQKNAYLIRKDRYQRDMGRYCQ